jgi:hypothetical protein
VIPKISMKRAEGMASVVIQLIKAAAAQSAEKDLTFRDNVLKELKYILQLYLNDEMARRAGDDRVNR